MEKGDGVACKGVLRLSPRALEFVATVASQTQILKCGGSAGRGWHNMVDQHRDADDFRTQAVATTLVRLLDYPPADSGRDSLAFGRQGPDTKPVAGCAPAISVKLRHRIGAKPAGPSDYGVGSTLRAQLL
jgi:hypothetical protein